MHALWDGVLADQVFAAAPPLASRRLGSAYAASLTALIEEHADSLAAVIVEPVIQGAGGMRFHDPGYLRVLREACTAHGVLLIFDEIATGFGRSGSLFAAGHAGVSPDVMCVGKALTAATYRWPPPCALRRWRRGSQQARFPCSRTGRRSWVTRWPARWRSHRCRCCSTPSGTRAGGQPAWPAGGRTDRRAGPARDLPGVTDVRVLGAVGVVQLDREVDVPAATRPRSGRVWLRPFRDLIYTMPPYLTSDSDLALICQGVLAAVQA